MKLSLSLLSLLLLCVLGATNALNIGSFNIQVLGKTKMADNRVVDTIIEILSRYDIVLVQEVRDVTDDTVDNLLSILNKRNKSKNYKTAVSTRLGRSDSKEQYVYFYDPEVIKLMGAYQYEDKNKVFERPPYAVRVRPTTAGGNGKDFFIIACHIQPKNAAVEMDALVDVHEHFIATAGNAALKKTITDRTIFLGDFNADCDYMTKKKWTEVRLRTSDKFTWLIGDKTRTTVADRDCAYDRVVVTKGLAVSKGVGISAVPYNFIEKMKMSSDNAKLVSDHFPVDITVDFKKTAGAGGSTKNDKPVKSPPKKDGTLTKTNKPVKSPSKKRSLDDDFLDDDDDMDVDYDDDDEEELPPRKKRSVKVSA
ncbi:DNASE1 [Acrasis kona]|uniref:DNASE1 n=1 Tax=Acrasis kona TaxID=1008807 RepID=A0AAW2Z554_9EUKA